MTETTNRRRENRVPISLKAYYSFDRVEGVGVLANISYSGALIEDTSMQPEIGTQIVLYLFLKPPGAFKAVSPFKLAGHVVRHSSTGFAIEYDEKFDPNLRRMLDDAIAIVATSREAPKGNSRPAQ